MNLIPGPHLALVGLMGVGKTVVGTAVADKLGRRHADLDALVANRVGRSVGVIFAENGEGVFRDLEEGALSSVLRGDGPLVLSTGGGVVERRSNRSLLNKRAFVVWLKAKPEILLTRIGDVAGRPLLNVDNPDEALGDLDRRRRTLYEEVSDLAIDTDALDVDAVADMVEKAVRDKARVGQ